MEKTKGYVYILTNRNFRDDWVKIGKSSRSVDIRSKELDNTAVPLPFDVYAIMQTEKYNEAETAIHKQIDRLTDRRIRQNREFFNLEPALALEIMLDLAKLSPDAIVEKYENNKPRQIYPVIEEQELETKEKSKGKIRPPFDFSMVGLTVGDEVIFDALGLSVKIAGKNKSNTMDGFGACPHSAAPICQRKSRTIPVLIRVLNISAIKASPCRIYDLKEKSFKT